MAKYNWRKHRKPKFTPEVIIGPHADIDNIRVNDSGVYNISSHNLYNSTNSAWSLVSRDQGPLCMMFGSGTLQWMGNLQAGDRLYIESDTHGRSEIDIAYEQIVQRPEPIYILGSNNPFEINYTPSMRQSTQVDRFILETRVA